MITSLGLNNINIDKFNKDSLNYEKTLNSPVIENGLNNINIDKFNKDSLNSEKTLNSPVIENLLDKELSDSQQ